MKCDEFVKVQNQLEGGPIFMLFLPSQHSVEVTGGKLRTDEWKAVIGGWLPTNTSTASHVDACYTEKHRYYGFARVNSAGTSQVKYAEADFLT